MTRSRRPWCSAQRHRPERPEPSGVEAGIAAGMTVVGLTAAGHIQPGTDERLAAAGAHHVVSTFAAIAQILQD